MTFRGNAPCPICGKSYKRHTYVPGAVYPRCNPSTLARIDARHAAFEEREEEPREPSFEERLSDGFLMNRLAG